LGKLFLVDINWALLLKDLLSAIESEVPTFKKLLSAKFESNFNSVKNIFLAKLYFVQTMQVERNPIFSIQPYDNPKRIYINKKIKRNK
jgi:hypothetical protein